MTTFAYLHFNEAELQALYLYDGEYEYFDLIPLHVTISSLSDACSIYTEKSYERRLEEIGEDLSVYDYLYSNNPVRAYAYLQERRVVHTNQMLTLSALYDLAAATLHRQFQLWLDNNISQPPLFDKEMVHTFAKIQGILNRERNV